MSNDKSVCKIIRTKDLVAMLGVSRSTVYNWLDHKSKHHRPEFPRPIKIGKAAIGWLEADLVRFVQHLERT